MRLRRARRERGAAVGNRGQRLVIDVDEPGRILGNVAIVCDDDGDGLADVHHFVTGERRPVEVLLVARARQPDDHEFGREVSDEVSAREDGMHAGKR